MTLFDYTPITEAETDPEGGGTASLAKRWWKNPIAMLQGADGAPRFQPNYTSGVAASGSALTFSGFDQFGGLTAEGGVFSGGQNIALSAQFSSDGATFSTATAMLNFGVASQNQWIRYKFFIDLETGNFVGETSGPIADLLVSSSGTITGGATNITHFRFLQVSAQKMTAGVWRTGPASVT